MKETFSYSIGESNVGLILVAESQNGVLAVILGSSKKELKNELQKMHPKSIFSEREDSQSLKAVLAFIENPSKEFKSDMDIRGTDFQKKVWHALTKIKCGTTVSYKELAQKIGKPKSVRAVANACGANDIAIVIPCHRVVRSNGSISGFRWGTERKRKLLKNEGVFFEIKN